MSWSIEQARELYSVRQWSDGFFDVDAQGRVVVRATHDQTEIPLVDILQRALQQNHRPPLLLTFPHILVERAGALQSAFDSAIAATGYAADYRIAYPIKVNHSANLVRQLVAAAGTGLEAGSKAELVAVLACSKPGGLVICNGYKDEAYIRLALLGQAIGLEIYLVVEKLSELALIERIAAQQKQRPKLGIRLRLACVADGKWQNSGGERAKFGLTPAQVLTAVEALREGGQLDRLCLLHFHLGSQVSNLQDIKAGLQEATRYLVELSRLGVQIEALDIGGGLGVDYEAAGSRSYFSINYGLQAYAKTVVAALDQCCQQHGLKPPRLISESGRALSAHHAVLVVNVLALEKPAQGVVQQLDEKKSDAATVRLRSLLDGVEDGVPAELLHDAKTAFAEAKQGFVDGQLNLAQRASTELFYYRICTDLKARLRPSKRAHRALIDELQEILSDQCFCNFSVFRSTPDAWAIDQVFPVMPLQSLDRRPSLRACVQDLTCDSDGRLARYVEDGVVEQSMAIHDIGDGEDYALGIFLVGAYQEILGDNHNLFGLTHMLEADRGGDLRLVRAGQTTQQVLADVGFRTDWLRHTLQQRIEIEVAPEKQAGARLVIDQALAAYTYLAGPVET